MFGLDPALFWLAQNNASPAGSSNGSSNNGASNTGSGPFDDYPLGIIPPPPGWQPEPVTSPSERLRQLAELAPRLSIPSLGIGVGRSAYAPTPASHAPSPADFGAPQAGTFPAPSDPPATAPMQAHQAVDWSQADPPGTGGGINAYGYFDDVPVGNRYLFGLGPPQSSANNNSNPGPSPDSSVVPGAGPTDTSSFADPAQVLLVGSPGEEDLHLLHERLAKMRAFQGRSPEPFLDAGPEPILGRVLEKLSILGPPILPFPGGGARPALSSGPAVRAPSPLVSQPAFPPFNAGIGARPLLSGEAPLVRSLRSPLIVQPNAGEGPLEGATTPIENGTQQHHPYVKYLGGPAKQDLMPLPKALHYEYHGELDGYLPRQWGTPFYRSLPPDVRQQVLQGLGTYTKKFDADHGTQFYDAMTRNGFPFQ
jgi:hypothetical protein